MSFHAYLRRLKDKQQSSGLSDKLKLLNDEVEELKTKVIKKEGTKVNMKDLPQPILLSRQVFFFFFLQVIVIKKSTKFLNFNILELSSCRSY